jgi:hypothetical protein
MEFKKNFKEYMAHKAHKLAPFNTMHSVLKRPCKHQQGYPETIAWNVEEFAKLVSMYGYDAIPEHIDRSDLDALCLHFAGVLPNECMRGYEFKAGGKIGQGAGGEVHIVCRKDDCNYAAKYVILNGEDIYLNEVNIMNKLSQIGIGIPCIENFTCNLPMYNIISQQFEIRRVGIIVMPLAEGSGLELIEQYDFEQLKPIFVGILATLVESGIMHRDLKLENMVVYQGEIKLIDYGLSWEFGTEDLHKGQSNWTFDKIPEGWDPLYDTHCLIQSLKRRSVPQEQLDSFAKEMKLLVAAEIFH